MRICDFCDQLRANGECALGLDKPKRMSCKVFEPGVDRFCSNAADFVNAAQLVRMATYFDIKGSELKKVAVMARDAEQDRALAVASAAAASARAETAPSFGPPSAESRFGRRFAAADLGGGRDRS